MNRDAILKAIIELRGGIPECCDFCGQAFTKKNPPIPEEAGQWACTECFEKWNTEEASNGS